MKLSIITVVLNHSISIRATIESVLNQTWPDVEYIIIDGGSTDGTREIVESYGDRIKVFLTEPDHGPYDAMNKGIHLATGDVVGMLNADDIYTTDRALERVVAAFQNHDTDTLFADIHFVKPPDWEKTVRYISGRYFKPWQLRFGFMPPHPTFFVRRNLFEQYGRYKTDYRIAADYELIIRFLHTHQVSYQYLPMDMVRMRTGGRSTKSIHSTYILNQEIVRACSENGIHTSMPLLFMKYFIKIFQYVRLFPRNTKA
jgi:glycosyltransferase involved in cell wall biosynthesis